MPPLDSCTPQDVRDACAQAPVEVADGLARELGGLSDGERQQVACREMERIKQTSEEYLPDLELFFEPEGAGVPLGEYQPPADAGPVVPADSGNGGAGGAGGMDAGGGGARGAGGGGSDAGTDAPAEVPAPQCGAGADNNLLRSADVQRVFERNFDSLDADHDGHISEGELDSAMVNPCYTGEDAALIAMLDSRREDLEELSDDEWGDENDGITRADIARFNEIANSSERSQDDSQLVGRVDYNLSRGHESLDGASRDLFANHDNPADSIRPEAVRQGALGDCYFDAALASLANTPEGRQSIQNMIQDNGDGTYTVTFPGDPENPVTVDAPTDAELARYNAGSEHGTWPAVLEKAYGRYCDAENVDPHDGIPNGSTRALGLSILTGRDIDTDQIAMTSTEETHRKLSEAVAEGRPVTAAINNELGSLVDLSDNQTDDAGLACGHVYSVTNYNPETRMVTVRNPWGHGEPTDAEGNPLDGTNDGEFQMTLEQFERNFSRVSYVERQGQ